jgi:hypothetical protein
MDYKEGVDWYEEWFRKETLEGVAKGGNAPQSIIVAQFVSS